MLLCVVVLLKLRTSAAGSQSFESSFTSEYVGFLLVPGHCLRFLTLTADPRVGIAELAGTYGVPCWHPAPLPRRTGTMTRLLLLLLLCLALIAAPPTASARRSKKQKAHTPLKSSLLSIMLTVS